MKCGDRVRYQPEAKSLFSPLEEWGVEPAGDHEYTITAITPPLDKPGSGLSRQHFVTLREFGSRAWDHRLWTVVHEATGPGETEVIVDVAAGLVQCGHRKLAIIGAGATRWAAPWDDRSWCFLALNEIAQPHYDRHVELHPRAVQSEQDLAFLRACPAPCYVLNVEEWEGLIPNPVRYPLERVLEVTRGRRYFTNTFAYETALAIADGFAEIGLWGVDLAGGTLRERLVENPCVAYWVGVAEGRGITVTVPSSSTLCRQDLLYGYDYHAEMEWVLRECEEAAATLPRDRWPRVLQRLGTLYGGRTEVEMVRRAAQIGRTEAGALTPEECAAINKIADAVAIRVAERQGKIDE